MTQKELNELCFLKILNSEQVSDFKNFSCGNGEGYNDLNDFFQNDALSYQKKLLGKTYIFRSRKEPFDIVTAFTLSNDSIRITNRLADEDRYKFLEDTDLRNKEIKRFPSVLLGRLATNEKYSGLGFGSAVMNLIKNMFRINNKTGCRFIIVDALNNTDTIRFYQRNGFKFLINEERLEAKYVGIGIGHLPLHTRLMYYDLLELTIP